MLKEETVGFFLKWRSLGTFLSTRRERCKTKHPDKLQFTIGPPLYAYESTKGEKAGRLIRADPLQDTLLLIDFNLH